MDSYYFDREDALYEMYEDAMNTFEDDEEKDQEEEDDYYNHPSLTAADRNPSMLR